MIDCRILRQRFAAETLTCSGGQPIDMDNTVIPGKICPFARRCGIMVRTWFRAAKKDSKSTPTITGITVVCFATPDIFPHIFDAMHVPWLFEFLKSANPLFNGNSGDELRAVELKLHVMQRHNWNLHRKAGYVRPSQVVVLPILCKAFQKLVRWICKVGS